MKKTNAAYLVAILLTAFAWVAALPAVPACAGDTDSYYFDVPRELLKNKKSAECVDLQNASFSTAMYQIRNNEFVDPLDSDEQAGDNEKLQGDACTLSKGALRILRNAAYARHGRTFQSKDLEKFFYKTHKKMFKKNPKYKQRQG